MTYDSSSGSDRGVSPYLSPGALVGNYRIESFIDRGGMAFVYEATDLRLDRHVALKVLAPELTREPDFQKRFLQESRFAASLDHPNIVPIYEAGQAGELLYIAMRYVPGEDLSIVLRRGQLETGRALNILSGVSRALDAAHSNGLVHRDVKPGNILVVPASGQDQEHVYLSDFGLTKRSSSMSRITASGMFTGTMAYIAPEQIQGQQLDARTDLYALGCTAYECLTGSAPFVRDDQAALLWAHLSEIPVPLSLHRPELAAADPVLAKALAKQPADRYQSAQLFITALLDALDPSRRTGGATVLGKSRPVPAGQPPATDSPSPPSSPSARSPAPVPSPVPLPVPLPVPSPVPSPIPDGVAAAAAAETAMGRAPGAGPGGESGGGSGAGTGTRDPRAPGVRRRKRRPAWQLPLLVAAVLGALILTWSLFGPEDDGANAAPGDIQSSSPTPAIDGTAAPVTTDNLAVQQAQATRDAEDTARGAQQARLDADRAPPARKSQALARQRDAERRAAAAAAYQAALLEYWWQAVNRSHNGEYYENCDAARAAGVAPATVTDPGYALHLDDDGDGIACEDGEVGPPIDRPAATGRTGPYRNCAEANAYGAAPVIRGTPGYGPHLDRDNDGVGCEESLDPVAALTIPAGAAPPPPPADAPPQVEPTTDGPSVAASIEPEPEEAGDSDPATEPVDPPSEPVDPPSEPVDPPSEPVDPPSEPVDPPSEPVDPPSEPVDPPSEPVDPPSEPVDPPSEPVDPPSEPVDPPSEPVDPPSEPVDPPGEPAPPPDPAPPAPPPDLAPPAPPDPEPPAPPEPEPAPPPEPEPAPPPEPEPAPPPEPLRA